MTDANLKQDILDELEFEPALDASDIGVAVEDGIVTLSGHVATYPQKQLVETVVSRIRGVKGIAEEILVRLPGDLGTDDDEIARRAVDLMKWSTMVPDGHVQVVVEKGWVTLKGTLDWNYQKIGAQDALHDLQGVRGITNEIVIRPRVSSADIKQRIEDALKRSAEVDAADISVRVDGNRVILEGNVKAWNERHIAEKAAWASAGVTSVEDRLTVS